MNLSKHQPPTGQAKSFGKRVRRALIDRDLSVTDLAKRIQRPRTSVSKAIHQGIFPAIQTEIHSALFTA